MDCFAVHYFISSFCMSAENLITGWREGLDKKSEIIRDKGVKMSVVEICSRNLAMRRGQKLEHPTYRSNTQILQLHHSQER